MREIELCMKYPCKRCPINKACEADQRRQEKQRENDIKGKKQHEGK